MRRRPLVQLALAALTAASFAVPLEAAAQSQGRRADNSDQRDDEANARRKKRNEEWSDGQLRLPGLKNAGPCPFVKVLYDAGRYAEFEGGREAASAVAYTGEIEGVSAGCAYKDDEPIRVRMNLLFALGRGPQGEGASKDYRYWIAVTDRNKAVLAKEYFTVRGEFSPGVDRVLARDEINDIVIPRSDAKVSGANFEVLVGFEVTPAMAAFNREGKRFRVNATGQRTASAADATGVASAQ